MGLYTAILLILMMANVLAALFVVWTLRGFLAGVWVRITTPTNPPWKRNHIGLNHVRTVADTDHIKNRTLVLRNYKTTL